MEGKVKKNGRKGGREFHMRKGVINTVTMKSALMLRVTIHS